MDGRRMIEVEIRKGAKGKGIPDLTISGKNAAGQDLMLIVELKTSAKTGLTDHEKTGYEEHFKNLPKKRGCMAFVVPSPYSHAAQIPDWAKTLNYSRLRVVLENSVSHTVSKWLLSDIWTHFIDVELSHHEIVDLLEDGDDRRLQDFLRALLDRTNSKKYPHLRGCDSFTETRPAGIDGGSMI